MWRSTAASSHMGAPATDPGEYPTQAVVECFQEAGMPELLWRTVLHTADLSNATRPFKIARVWAWKCLEEFFIQGDREKELSLPVQPINDRQKVNCPLAQVGFIEFLVAPLALILVKIFPPYVACAEQLLNNLGSWQEEWHSATP